MDSRSVRFPMTSRAKGEEQTKTRYRTTADSNLVPKILAVRVLAAASPLPVRRGPPFPCGSLPPMCTSFSSDRSPVEAEVLLRLFRPPFPQPEHPPKMTAATQLSPPPTQPSSYTDLPRELHRLKACHLIGKTSYYRQKSVRKSGIFSLNFPSPEVAARPAFRNLHYTIRIP